MKIHLTLCISVLISWNATSQRDNPPIKASTEQKGFKYEEIGDFSEGAHFIADIIPLRAMMYGNYQNVGIGTGLSFFNLANRFSIESDFAFNYFTNAWLESSLNHGIENFRKKSSMEFGSVIGCRITSKKEKKDSYTFLKREGNVINYTRLPATHSSFIQLQAGFKQIGMYNQSNLKFTSSSYDPWYDTTTFKYGTYKVRNLFQNRSVYLGVKFVKTVDTRFKTDTYGEVSSHNMREIYGGVLIGMKTEIPTIYRYLQNDSFDVHAITDLEPLPLNGQQELENDYNFLPVGFRVGWINSDKRSGIAFNWEFALYPGYYSIILQQFSVRLGLTYRIHKNFK